MERTQGRENGRAFRITNTSSPFCVFSVVFLLLNLALLALCVYMATISVGNVGMDIGVIGLILLVTSLIGALYGGLGWLVKKEKRRIIGAVCCIADSVIFLLFAVIYVVGFIYGW